MLLQYVTCNFTRTHMVPTYIGIDFPIYYIITIIKHNNNNTLEP